jgi:N-methylhydantoinase A
MIVFGGSGPVHGCRIARKLRVPRVICPSGAGVMSAFGLLSSPVGFELVQSHRIGLEQLDRAEFRRLVQTLEARVRKQLQHAGIDAADSRTELRLDMRYVGQGYEVEVLVPAHDLDAVFPRLPELFGRAYENVFGQSFADKEVEIVAWKVEVQGPVPGGDAPYALRMEGRSETQAIRRRRQAYFADMGYMEADVVDRYALVEGDVVKGPALVEETESTCVLAPGDKGWVDDQLNLVIDIGAQQ